MHKSPLFSSLAVSTLVLACVLATHAGGQGPAPAQPVPKPAPGQKVVGFSQTGAESDWRVANTTAMREEAKHRGYDLRLLDAQSKSDKQIFDVRALIAQKVDLIVISPLMTDPAEWQPVLTAAKEAGIPVIIQDRRINVPTEFYHAFIGSDFCEEGRQAARWLAQKTNGHAAIFQLLGEPTSAPADERQRGFEEILKDYPGMEILKSQTANFRRATGREVMAAFLQSPAGKECTAVFAHNDDMALGAIAAIEAAGKKPGIDILIVSIDAIKDALQAAADGKLNCTVECNPNTAPQIFDAIDIYFHRPVPTREAVIDQSQARALLPTRQY